MSYMVEREKAVLIQFVLTETRKAVTIYVEVFLENILKFSIVLV